MPKFGCGGRCCPLRPRCPRWQVRSVAHPLLQEPRVLREGLPSLLRKFFLSLSGALRHETPRLPLRYGEMWEIIALKLRGGEDSLFTNAKLAARIVSSILRDSNLKNVEAMCVEEALALSLQGTVSKRLSAFFYSSHRCVNFIC